MPKTLAPGTAEGKPAIATTAADRLLIAMHDEATLHAATGYETEVRQNQELMRSLTDPHFMEKTTHNQIVRYETSRDYELLYDLMRQQSIICIIDSKNNCRTVARTLFSSHTDGDESLEISNSGYGYIYVNTRSRLIECCLQMNVEFIVPNHQ